MPYVTHCVVPYVIHCVMLCVILCQKSCELQLVLSDECHVMNITSLLFCTVIMYTNCVITGCSVHFLCYYLLQCMCRHLLVISGQFVVIVRLTPFHIFYIIIVKLYGPLMNRC